MPKKSLEQQQQDKQVKMTTAPVGKLILSMSGPTILCMLITSLYNMADTFFVGQLHNVSATGAVGIVFSFMAVIQAIGFFFGHGSGNYISRHLGSGNTENASAMAVTGVVLSFGFGVIISIVGLIFREPLIYILQATPTIYKYAYDYITYILFAVPFMCCAFTLNNQLRFQGNVIYGTIGMISGGILNIAIDPLLIFTCEMGVSGAALATMISQIFSCIMLFIMHSKSDAIRLDIKKLSLKPKIIKEMFRGGIPSLCRQSIGSLATICLNAGAGYVGETLGTGDNPITAMTVVGKIIVIASSVMIGFGQGFQPVCGMNYGSKQFKRVSDSFWFCVKVSFCGLLVFSAVGLIFAEPLIRLFQDNDDVVAFGAMALRFQCITFPLSAWIVMCNMMQQTMGKAVRASVLALARQGFTFVPLVLLLPHLIGPIGVQLAQPIADVITLAISIPLQMSILKELKLGIGDKT